MCCGAWSSPATLQSRRETQHVSTSVRTVERCISATPRARVPPATVVWNVFRTDVNWDASPATTAAYTRERNHSRGFRTCPIDGSFGIYEIEARRIVVGTPVRPRTPRFRTWQDGRRTEPATQLYGEGRFGEELMLVEGVACGEMGLLKLLRRRAGDDSATLYECRDCGHSLPAAAEECPRCGSPEIAEYSFG